MSYHNNNISILQNNQHKGFNLLLYSLSIHLKSSSYAQWLIYFSFTTLISPYFFKAALRRSSRNALTELGPCGKKILVPALGPRELRAISFIISKY